MVALLLVVMGGWPAPAVPATGGVVTGAVAGTGGWLVRAPGTPWGASSRVWLSLLCWLRMDCSGEGLGR